MGHYKKRKHLHKIDVQNRRQEKTLKEVLGGLDKHQFQFSNNPTFRAGESYLQNLLQQTPESSEEEYQANRQPMMTEFEQEILPGLEERFAGLGAGQSSGFQQTLAAAQNTLKERLAALKMNFGRQREESLYNRQMASIPYAGQYGMAPAQSALQRAQLGLGTQPFQYYNSPKKGPGAFGQFMQSMGPGIGMGIGALIGGPPGAVAGAAIGAGASGAMAPRQQNFGYQNNL